MIGVGAVRLLSAAIAGVLRRCSRVFSFSDERVSV